VDQRISGGIDDRSASHARASLGIEPSIWYPPEI
jgi:hypothetical protein